MKGLLLLVGVVALLVGLLFAGQGLGVIPWPPNSFMISDVHWVYYGSGIAAAGLVLIWISQRRGG
jgi:hypothetical protein